MDRKEHIHLSPAPLPWRYSLHRPRVKAWSILKWCATAVVFWVGVYLVATR